MAKLTVRPLRPTSKGQITLPISIRRQLNVSSVTLLDVSVKDNKIILEPLNLGLAAQNTRIYSSEEIDEFLAEDKLSSEDATFFKKLLEKTA